MVKLCTILDEDGEEIYKIEARMNNSGVLQVSRVDSPIGETFDFKYKLDDGSYRRANPDDIDKINNYLNDEIRIDNIEQTMEQVIARDDSGDIAKYNVITPNSKRRNMEQVLDRLFGTVRHKNAQQV